MFGDNPEIEEIDTSGIVDIIFEYDSIKSLVLELENGESGQFALDVQMLFYQIFGANGENFEAIKQLYFDNFNFFYHFAESFDVRKDVLAQLLYRDNAMGIAIGHMPELSYTLICSCDSRFVSNPCKLNDGTYQILHIEKPKSFSLMEKNIAEEVFSYRDGIMESSYVSAEQFADGSISIYLPKNGEYEYIGMCSGVSRGINDPLQGETIIDSLMPSTGGSF